MSEEVTLQDEYAMVNEKLANLHHERDQLKKAAAELEEKQEEIGYWKCYRDSLVQMIKEEAEEDDDDEDDDDDDDDDDDEDEDEDEDDDAPGELEVGTPGGSSAELYDAYRRQPALRD